MITRITLDISELEALGVELNKAPAIIERELNNFVNGALSVWEQYAVAETPVFTGEARDSIEQLTGSRPPFYEGELIMQAPHGMVLEHGRRPGQKRPPIAPIQLWVRRVLGITDAKEVAGVAYVIARAIGERGTKPVRMFGKAWDRGAGKIDEMAEGIPGNVFNALVTG